MKKNIAVVRVRIIFFALVFFAFILICKLYLVQIVSGEEFSIKANHQYVSENSNLINRGSIFFTTREGKTVTAAMQQLGYTVFINPKNLIDPEQAYEIVSRIIPVDKEDFFQKANKKDDPYEEIARKVGLDKGEKIKEANIKGVGAVSEKWRFYPGQDSAAHEVGIFAYQGSELAGRYGLEKQYEDVLKREDGSVYVNFFAEVFLNLKEQLGTKGKNSEGDIVTSIEPSVETFLQKQLEKVNKEWDSEYTGGIVIEPKTGRVVAMASYPTFNPNTFHEENDVSIFSNPLVENVYEMGSIIKPLTMVAGVDSGAVTHETTYFDAGFLYLNNQKISNFDGKGRGQVNMQEVLNNSLNTGVAFVVKTMGKEKFSQYMKNFGIDKKTEIDLPNEAAPLTENLNSPRDIEHATASYGQGIAMTPMSTVRALSTLANGGRLITPHLVTEIDYKAGMNKKIDYPLESQPQVIEKESADEISRMLVKVVDEALLGGTVKHDHYSIAAKTGTAQIARNDGRGYYDDKFLHSFFGYFPAYDARFLVFLFTYDPKGVKYASETLTHSFMDIADYLIQYYEIPPDR